MCGLSGGRDRQMEETGRKQNYLARTSVAALLSQMLGLSRGPPRPSFIWVKGTCQAGERGQGGRK